MENVCDNFVIAVSAVGFCRRRLKNDGFAKSARVDALSFEDTKVETKRFLIRVSVTVAGTLSGLSREFFRCPRIMSQSKKEHEE
jgi:hypothetical protein